MIPKYLSYSALTLWERSPEQFYTKYMLKDKIPRVPQTDAMSVGSAFDAFVKAALHRDLFGSNHKDSAQFDVETIFETQVEEPRREFAWGAGQKVFGAYQRSGAYADLWRQLDAADEEPMMEFTSCGNVNEHGGVYAGVGRGVPILGKPDLVWIKNGLKIVLDWKVNGYCSEAGGRAIPGYVMFRDGWSARETGIPPSKTNGKFHRSAMLRQLGDFTINMEPYLETSQRDWTTQLCCYAWLTGSPIGADFLLAIDQLVCGRGISVAEHKSTVTEKFQREVYERFQGAWDIITSDHVLRHLSKEESADRCRVLQDQAAAYSGKHGDFLRACTGRK